MSLSAGTQIGKYVVRRKIAEGGMAEIYLAASVGPEGFQKEVVIKRIRPVLANDPEFVEMFVAEAQVASKITHANVVQIFDFDKHEDTYYLAMEYVRGRSLWDVRKQAKARMEPMAPLLVAQIGMEVARGLHSAHGLTVGGQPMHVVHRDVTPHNVLLSYEGAVKLTDFGIAKAGNRLTAAGVLKGKFAYMSPEQSRGEPVDQRTDVFALGVVLWELLTGGRLFEGDSDLAVLKSVQQSAIAPPRRLNPEVAPALDEAVMKALARDLDARFQTAQELERALAAYVFANAHSYDDTDVGGYLRRLFMAEREAELALDSEPVPSPGARLPTPGASPLAPPRSRDGSPGPGEMPGTVKQRPPAGAQSSTYVLGSAQRPVVAEPPAPPSESFATEPAMQAKQSASARAPRAPKWPLAVGGAALVGALAIVGLRARKPSAPRADGAPAAAAESVPATRPSATGSPDTTGPAPVRTVPEVAAAAQAAPDNHPSADHSPVKEGRPAEVAVLNGPPAVRSAATPKSALPPPPVAVTGSNPAPAAVAGSAPATAPVAAGTKDADEGGAGEGTVLLRVTPWAYFWLDGVKQRDLEGGARRIHLAAGDHQLRFSQNKHRVRNVSVHVDPGKTTVIHYNALTDTLGKP